MQRHLSPRSAKTTKIESDNQVRLVGRLIEIRQRWTPDGKLSLIAQLLVGRPRLGAPRRNSDGSEKMVEEQPIPLRAQGEAAKQLLSLDAETVIVEGTLRRRYYNRDGEPSWGQLEVWVSYCRAAPQPMEVKES